MELENAMAKTPRYYTSSVQSWLAFARMMRGCVPEWDGDYIEKIIPASILVYMNKTCMWIDADEYIWGYCVVHATKLEDGRNAVVVATRYVDMGYHEEKFVTSPDSCIETRLVYNKQLISNAE